MNKAIAIIVGVVLLLMFLLFSMTYTVSFNEVAIKSTFGQADEDSVVTEPGLKFKLPFLADRVEKFDTRLQYLPSPEQEIPTADGQTVVVQAFLMWRVDGDNARQFDRSYGSISEAEGLLDDQLRDALPAISQFEFDELLGQDSKLAAAEDAILQKLAPLRERGVEPVAVGISQLKLPPKVTRAVLKRMEATRKTLAEGERSVGNSAATRIVSDASTKAEKIRAFARQRAEEIRAKGNVQAAEYLSAMGEDASLAIFLAWLDTLEASLQTSTTAFLPTDFAPFHLLDMNAPIGEGGIPQPKQNLIPGSSTNDENDGDS